MTARLTRALGLALVHVLAQTLLGFAVLFWTDRTSSARIVALVLVVVCSMSWGFADGRRDRLRHGDRSETDFPILWLQAAVIGGLVAGAATWLCDLLPYLSLGRNSLLFELTAGAGWIVLLIYVPAMVGVGAGRVRANRVLARGA
ncbi:B-4DMT family transporter [Nocardia jiangxiensis]|uniref:B-4DMT family transporter n=1 Tax=Nocardia jiangxiensis TaxID=282685 RepID=A0ABW6SCH9_9NOCA|nr:B-4DMT family transporter [Nocardia jiangxiensis]